MKRPEQSPSSKTKTMNFAKPCLLCLAVLSVLLGLCFIIVPKIHSIEFEEGDSLYPRFTITASNLPQSPIVRVNGTPQPMTTKENENTLSFQFCKPEYALASKLEIVIQDPLFPFIRSRSFTLSNPWKRKSAEAIPGNSAFLESGSLVAHGFGAIDGIPYTNSLEAFLSNYDKGHRVFEVDFQLTSDGTLATLHDRADGIGTFDEENQKSPYTLLTFEDVCELMKDYPDITIITDTKIDEDYLKMKVVLDEMQESIDSIDASLYDRIVIQVYNQENYYFTIDNYPFTSFIYTLYRSKDTDEQVIEFVRKESIPAVTMWEARASADFIKALNEAGAKTYAHTVNDIEQARALFDNGLHGLYTDSIVYSDLE